MNLPKDQATRERIRSSLNESLLVEAAAGTGKTHELVQRLVNLISDGVRVDQLVAVTFTRKAAGELKLRLRSALEQARSAAQEGCKKAALTEALCHLEEARIGTIHSFCVEILKDRPVEAGVDPAFIELDEPEARRVYEQAFRQFMQSRLANPSATMTRALARRAPSYFTDQQPLSRLSQAGWQLVTWRDFDAPWQSPQFDLAQAADGLVVQVAALAELANRSTDPDDKLFQSLAKVREFAEWLHRAQMDGGRSTADIEARLIDLAPSLSDWFKKTKYYSDGLPQAQVLDLRANLLKAVSAFKAQADAQLAVALRSELSELVHDYDRAKARRGALDFEDLLVKVRNLIRDNAQVRHYLQRRHTHLLVDEYQDTDPLQTEILLLLSAADPTQSDWRKVQPRGGSLFLVGDPKQSIYRFRRADIVLYQRVRQQFKEAGVGLVHLSHSFRATAPLQEAINLAFEPEMGSDNPGQPDYVPLRGGPDPSATQPSLVSVPVAYPHNSRRLDVKTVAAQLPEAVGAFLQWLLNDSGWTVRDPDAPETRIPVAPRHIALLFKNITQGLSDTTRGYIQDLEHRGIPHLTVGSRSFRERDEVQALLNACSAIEWPQDELSVLATLRGPLFALPDDLLLRYQSQCGHLNPLTTTQEVDEELQPVQDALRFLGEIREVRNHQALPVTLSSLLRETRAQLGFALRPAGEQVLANLQRVIDLGRSFEAQGGLSFRGFVQRLSEETQRARSNEAPAFDEDLDGVRMMTVHAAKGLEFPIVILADINTTNRSVTPGRHLDADRRLAALRLYECSPRDLLDNEGLERQMEEAETVRVAYVAATRARDMLVLPGVGEGTKELFKYHRQRISWTAPLEKVFYPILQRYGRPDPAPGVPIVGKYTVLGQPEYRRNTPRCIAPGLHVGRVGGPGAVWLDPTQLQLEAPRVYGLQHMRYLAADSEGVAQAGIEAYEAWRSQRIATIEQGEVSEIDLISASETDLAPEDFNGIVDQVLLKRDAERPSGPRFGTLVHSILQDVDYGADHQGIELLATMHGRLLGASPQEVQAAVAPVQSALSHELLTRALAADRMHREYPVVFDTEEGQRVDGSIDLAFYEDGMWFVVDFKTDADPKKHRAQHLRQMQWYVTALQGLTNAEVMGWLMYL